MATKATVRNTRLRVIAIKWMEIIFGYALSALAPLVARAAAAAPASELWMTLQSCVFLYMNQEVTGEMSISVDAARKAWRAT